MADFFDYLSWRGDLPFDAVPPNPVDTLILSELSYIGFDGLVPGDFLHPVPLKVAAEAFLALPDWENRVRIKKDDVRILPIFDMIAKMGNIPEHDMYNTFNMGVGMCVVVAKEDVERTLDILRTNGDDAYVIGEIIAATDKDEKVILC